MAQNEEAYVARLERLRDEVSGLRAALVEMPIAMWHPIAQGYLLAVEAALKDLAELVQHRAVE